MAADTSSSRTLVDKPNTKSQVWKHFGLVPDADGKPKEMDKPRCKLCFEEVIAKYGNTSNLFAHLRNKHPLVYKTLEVNRKTRSEGDGTASQPLIVDALERIKKLDSSSKEHKELTKSVAICLAKDMLPIYTVEKEGFRAMLRKFNPRYDLPSRNHFSRVALPALYSETREKLEALLGGDEIEYFSSTTDLWSSDAMEPYLGYSIHYINKRTWELQSACLQVHYTPEDHTGINLKEALAHTIEEWHLDASKMVALTTDNARNMCLACELLGWRHLNCFGHNLDLAVQKGLADHRIERVLRVCRQVVAAFSYSWKRRRQMLEEQEKKSLPKHRLKADVKTRWGSVFDMIERIIEQREPIRSVLGGDRASAHLVPTWQDLDVLDSIFVVLKPLRDFVDLLAGEKRVTVSAVLPLLSHIKEKVLAHNESDTDLTSEMKSRIMNDLDSRYNEQTLHFLQICMVLDPRFKFKYVLDQDTKESLKQIVTDEMISNHLSAKDTTTAPLRNTNPIEMPPKKVYKTAWGRIFGEQQAAETPSSAETELYSDTAKRELENYLLYPLSDVESSPLQWWQLHQKSYPGLSKLALKYLSVCATSVPSERIFSTGGKVVHGRSRLKPDTVNELIFLAENLKL